MGLMGSLYIGVSGLQTVLIISYLRQHQPMPIRRQGLVLIILGLNRSEIISLIKLIVRRMEGVLSMTLLFLL